MMQRLNSLLLSLFLRHHALTAQQIQTYLKNAKHSYSLVAIYAELNRLLAQQVLLKQRALFILSITWVLESRSTLDHAYEQLVNARFLALTLPEPGAVVPAKHSWRFSTLRQLNEFWVQMILVLLNRSKSKTMWQYVPRLWFPYIDPEHDSQFQRSFRKGAYQIEMIVGGTSCLDTEPSKRQNAPFAYRSYLRQSPFHQQRQHYFCVIEDALLVVTITAKLAEKLDQLFQRTTTTKTFHPEELRTLVDAKYRTTLSLEYRTARLKAIRQKFASYFAQERVPRQY